MSKRTGVCKEAENRLPSLKSTKLEKEILGNVEKYRSFREAWSRIAAAQAAGFYFEAITLEESIISDRLASYLNGVRPDIKKDWGGNRDSFSALLMAVRLLNQHPVEADGFRDLFVSLDTWRACRNKAIHGLAKSASGKPTKQVETALQEACCAADTGARLARAVLKWHKEQFKKKSE